MKINGFPGFSMGAPGALEISRRREIAPLIFCQAIACARHANISPPTHNEKIPGDCIRRKFRPIPPGGMRADPLVNQTPCARLDPLGIKPPSPLRREYRPLGSSRLKNTDSAAGGTPFLHLFATCHLKKVRDLAL